MQEIGVIVIGAGQAGLAAGRALQKAGADFLILEQGQRACGSWPLYYDSLRLFSPSPYSSLTDRPFPGDETHYPRRDEVVAYLEAYADGFNLPIRYGARVVAVSPSADGHLVSLEDGAQWQAKAVIVASGTFDAPFVPSLGGAQEFSGEIVHSRDYRNPSAFAGKRVIVVGAANSAVQIAVELAAHADVTLAVRKPVRYAAQTLLGRDVHYWFGALGIDHVGFLSDQGTPVLDDGRYRAALDAGRPAQKIMFKAFSRDGVIWSDGATEPVDAIIFATGFRPHAPFLPANAFRADGGLAQKNGVSTTAPGIYFVGQPGLRSFSSATLRGVGCDAAYVVPRVMRRVRRFQSRLRAPSISCCGMRIA